MLLKTEKRLELHRAIELVLKENDPAQSDSEISDLAANLLEKVRKQLDKRLFEWNQKKLHPYFKWGEINQDVMLSFHSKHLTNGIESEESRFRLAEELSSHLKTIDPVLFEILGRKLLDFTGAESFVTRSSKDEGVDFGGIIKVSPEKGNIDFPITERIFQNMSFKLIGQAKRYQDDVTVKEIRELNGINNINILHKIVEKHPNDKIIKFLEDSSLPTILMFITTGRFSRDAKIFGEDVGMIMMDGIQIAQALLHMGIGCNRNNNGYWEVDYDQLELWLNN